ncbi:MAG: hypothetical protein L0215_14260, partial [Gemmataceae bacterium]|nr:hypothetical protein [Gemmataceae bacterium]
PAKQFVLHLRILEGDPEGSEEAGTIRAYQVPAIPTLSGSPFSWATGGNVPLKLGKTSLPVFVGTRLKGTIQPVTEGKVKVELSLDIAHPKYKFARARRNLESVSTRGMGLTWVCAIDELVNTKALAAGSGNDKIWFEIRVEQK